MKPDKDIAPSGSRNVARARTRAREILEKYHDARKKPCVMILIDCSGSMSGEPLEQARQGAIEFGREARGKGYLVGMVAFGSAASVVHEPGGTIEGFERSVLSLNAGGSTNMVAALQLGVSASTRRSRPKSLVVVTDGCPDDPEATLRTAKEAVASGFEILAIGTETADHGFLARLVTRAGTDLRVSTRDLSVGMKRIAGLLLPAR